MIWLACESDFRNVSLGKTDYVYIEFRVYFQDIQEMNAIFCHLEDFNITLDMLVETKVGKVMRRIALLQSDKLADNIDNQYRFRNRAGSLVEEWREVIATATPTGNRN